MEKKLELLGKSENPFKILGPDDFSGTSLEKLTLVDHENTGLDSMLVKRTMTIDGKERTVYLYSLAGTEGGVFSNDGATNASAILGMSDQYQLALYNAKKIQTYLMENDSGAILLTTGHSLGGGMAASISLQTGIPAITFNPAGTNFLTNGISNAFNTGWNQIDAYITPTDPLNAAQRLLFPLIGANGRTHTETILTPSGILDGHSVNNFVDHYFPSATVGTVNAPAMKVISQRVPDSSGVSMRDSDSGIVTTESNSSNATRTDSIGRDYSTLRKEQLDSISEPLKQRIANEERSKVSEAIPSLMKDVSDSVKTNLSNQIKSVQNDLQKISNWSENGTVTDSKKIIANGVESKLAENPALQKSYDKYSDLANKKTAIDRDLKERLLSTLDSNGLKSATNPSLLSNTFITGYGEIIANEYGKSKEGLLSKSEQKILNNNGGDIKSLYDKIPANVRKGIEKVMLDSGVKPDFDTLPNGNTIKDQYQRVVVAQYLDQQRSASIQKQMDKTLQEVNKIKKDVTKEVSNTVNSLNKQIKETLLITIPKLNEQGKPIEVNGKVLTEEVRIGDSKLTDAQKSYVETERLKKEQSLIAKEQEKKIQELIKRGETNIEDKVLQESIRLEREALTKVPAEKLREFALMEPDIAKRETLISEYKKQLADENSTRLKELDSLDFNQRVKSIVNYDQLGQGVNGGAYKLVISTFDQFKNINIADELAKIPEDQTVLRNKIKTNLETIQAFSSAEEFAKQTQSALCNVISGWEAAMLAGRNVEPDFSKFYVDQVLKGQVTTDTYGSNKAVFYGNGKDYLEPSRLLSNEHDFKTPEGREGIISDLDSTPSKVAQIHLDYEGDGVGDHFVIAYRDNAGEWRIKDQNESGPESDDNWKNGGKLSRALERGFIKDIRIVE
ncbi:hypothetical protein ACKZJ7_05245 [Leptospira sp. 'Mane']